MTQATTQFQIPALRTLGSTRAVAIIAAISLLVLGFLFWLLYFKPAAAQTSDLIRSLPALNAILNAISSILLIAAFIAARRRRYNLHIKLIFAALLSSTLFLASYIRYHSFHGDTKFLATGVVRPIYFFILITHILLSVLVVPMILTSLYLSLCGRMTAHRRVSRWTLPVWLYVSVTGVAIFALLKLFNTTPAT